MVSKPKLRKRLRAMEEQQSRYKFTGGYESVKGYDLLKKSASSSESIGFAGGYVLKKMEKDIGEEMYEDVLEYIKNGESTPKEQQTEELYQKSLSSLDEQEIENRRAYGPFRGIKSKYILEKAYKIDTSQSYNLDYIIDLVSMQERILQDEEHGYVAEPYSSRADDTDYDEIRKELTGDFAQSGLQDF